MLHMPTHEKSTPPPIAPWPSTQERRLTLRLLKYWQEIRREREFPSREDVDPDIISDIWPYCFLLDVTAGFREPVFAFLGRDLAKFSGVYIRGQATTLSGQGTLLDQATLHYRDVLDTRGPVSSDDEFLRYDGVRIIYRSILLPLGEGRDITHIFGAANGKEAPLT